MTRAELRAEGQRLGVPERAVNAFYAQRAGAKARGIEFLFSLPEWWAWWSTDDRWRRRGGRAGDLVMARLGDTGPYHMDNVYPATNSENVREFAQRPRRPRRMCNEPLSPKAERLAALGRSIRKHREGAGLSQRAIAERAGMAQPSVHNLEAGRVNPRLSVLQGLARAMDLPLHVLFKGL